MKEILKAAQNSYELWTTLENISSDDKKKIEEYTDREIVHEAEYVLSTFFEGGHANNDELIGEYEWSDPVQARKEVRALRRLIKKYKAH